MLGANRGQGDFKLRFEGCPVLSLTEQEPRGAGMLAFFWVLGDVSSGTGAAVTPWATSRPRRATRATTRTCSGRATSRSIRPGGATSLPPWATGLAGAGQPGGRVAGLHDDADVPLLRAALQESRSDFGFVAVEGYLYAIGGFLSWWDVEVRAQQFLASCERYSLATDRWEAVGEMPTPRRCPSPGRPSGRA